MCVAALRAPAFRLRGLGDVTEGVRLLLSGFASKGVRGGVRLGGCVAAAMMLAGGLGAQRPEAGERAREFLAQRAGMRGSSAAVALQRARAQHLAMQRGSASKAHGLQPEAGSLSAGWTTVGPQAVVSATYGALSGRITALALDPNDAAGNTLYAGTTGGGVWKSVNAAGPLGGVSFTALTDTLPVFSADAGSGVIASLSIGALAVQPVVNPAVLAGTGDPNDATDSYYGEGILRSADGGLTWTLAQGSHDGANGNHSFAGMAVAGLAFSSATPALAVAAFSNAGEAAFVDAANAESVPGLYFSTDAGLTWQMASIYDGAMLVQTPQPTPSGQVGNAATAVVWDAQRGLFVAAVRSHGYYSSADGETWTRLAAQPGAGLTVANCPVGLNGAGAATCPVFRGALAVQEATGDLYALTVDANNVDQGLWQDLCGAVSGGCAAPAPVFASRIDNGALEVGSGSAVISQGAYDLALAAVPATAGAAANGTMLYVATVDLYRCALAAGGSACSLRNTTNALNGCNAPAKVAAAQHAVAGMSETSGGPLVFVGNDGGMWRSTDGVAETGPVCDATDGLHFDNLNGTIGSLAEVVGFAEPPADADTLLVGLGENGSAATTSAATAGEWTQMSAGEGGFPAIDANAPENWMLAIGAGVNLKQCGLGGSCMAASFVPPATVGEAEVSDDAALLDAPSMLDPGDTANVLVGTCRVWRGAATGVGWSSASILSPAFDGTRPTACTATNPLVRSVGAGGPVGAVSSGVLAGSEVVYAGMAGTLDGGLRFAGAVFGTKTANAAFSSTSWANLALSPVTNDTANGGVFNPEGFDVSAVVVDAHDATGGTVYATIMGFGADAGGVPHVYRSVDFGSHWLNISANLPNAPANALAVDPNDANTVYVAMDTGVYATAAVGTCSAAVNCWSVLGTALPNAPVTELAAASAMATGDGRLGMLRASTYGRGIWQTPLLTAVSPAQPAMTLSVTSLTFAAQQVATQSAAQVVTVTSSGNAAMVFGVAAITGDFVETDTCAGRTLAVGSTCSFSVVFAPAATGPRTGLLTIYADVSGGQATVPLNGTATTAASIVLTPVSVAFAATVVNQTAAAQFVTISNTGGNTATLQAPVMTGDFAISANTCGAALAPSTECTVGVTFTPTASGPRTGTFAITDGSGGVMGTQTATLTGLGEAPATDTLAPGSLTFAAQTVGTASAAQQVTITNAGDVPLTLLNASMSPGDFTVVNGCGTSLAGHATCALSVGFVPTAAGSRTATLTFTDAVRSQTVAIEGVGVAGAGVSLSPASLAFAAIGNGLSSAVQAVMLTNNGGSVLTLAGVVASSNFRIAASSCGATLAVAAACTLQVAFAPAGAGPLSGTLTLTDNALPATQTVALSGLGIDFSLTSAGSTTATLSSGGSAAYPLLLSSVAGVTGSVAFTCTGQPVNSTCTVAPATPVLGSSTSVMVTVQTGILAGADPRGVAPWRLSGVVLALGLPCLLVLRRRRLASVVVLCVLVGMSGCGAEREIPSTGGGSGGTGGGTSSYPTPAGSYDLVVTGTSAGLARSVPLVLVVQ